jgi:hypothetical protein
MPRGQDPFALGLCLDLQAACLARSARLPFAVGLLQQLDLLVGVYIEALRWQARNERAGEWLVGDGRVRVHLQVGPVVLELEVV